MKPQESSTTKTSSCTDDDARYDRGGHAPAIVYRPVIFDQTHAADRAELQNLLDGNPSLTQHDALRGQLHELIKVRHPGSKLSSGQFQHLVEEHVGAHDLERYGVQVYYPWSNRLVSLLPEAEFVELRTSRNHHKITAEEQRSLMGKRVGVIGLSVGQSVALTVAMERSAGEIRLADFDTLELSNLNRLRTGVHNLGLPKVAIAAREIAEIDPFIRTTCFFEGITAANLDRFLLENGKLDLLFEESDGIDIKFLSRHRARELRIPVVMETSDRGLLDIERFDLEPDRPLFHGLAGDVGPDALHDLSAEEKLPYVLSIVSPQTMSPRMKASLLEIDQSIGTWPQLASEVVLGGAIAADTSRRILLGQLQNSGRFFVDLETLVRDMPAAETPEAIACPPLRVLLDIDASIDRHIAAHRMPSLRIDAEQVQSIVRAGTLAPSAGNGQPWRWVWQADTLFLFHDRGQTQSSFLDFEHSASRVALGAAAENAHLAASALGLSVRPAYFPNGPDDALAVAFTFDGAGESPRHPFAALADEIERRHTNRRAGPRRPIPDDALHAIRDAAESVAGAKLHLLTSGPGLSAAADLLSAIERLRLLHADSHRELIDEVRWTREHAARTGDGIDLDTLELSAADRAGLALIKDWNAVSLVASWGRGQGLGKMVRRWVDGAGAVGLIAMPSRSPIHHLLGGCAVQRAWLMATRWQVGFQPIAPLTYLLDRLSHGDANGMPAFMRDGLAAAQRQYRSLFRLSEQAAGILVFRLTAADAPATRSMRRPIADVFEDRSARCGSGASPGHRHALPSGRTA